MLPCCILPQVPSAPSYYSYTNATSRERVASLPTCSYVQPAANASDAEMLLAFKV